MTDLTLNARQKKLLSILNARHNVETGKELAAKLGVVGTNRPKRYPRDQQQIKTV